MLRGDVVAVGRQPAQIRRARRDELRPPVREVRRHLDPDAGQQAPGLPDEPDHVLDRHLARPRGQRQLRLVADAGHNFSDVLGLIAAWGAMALSRRPAGACARSWGP